MASINTTKPKKPTMSLHHANASLCTTLFFVVLFTIPALFLLHTPTSTTFCSSTATATSKPWSGNLLSAEFAWNRLPFDTRPPTPTLRIAVFSRKWPAGSTPGGMERHAYTLHTALSRRGHDVHVFTSPAPTTKSNNNNDPSGPTIHSHEGDVPWQWHSNKAWEQFKEMDTRQPFDVVHSESVSLPHGLARTLPNLAVSWHGIAIESLQSDIAQDLMRPVGEPISPSLNASHHGIVSKVINEIRFFGSYRHHIAISDSCGEILREVYQIPPRRVHVILNGVDDASFASDPLLGTAFRSRIGVPDNASLVFGVAGRLVRDKGHPILHKAFSELISNRSDIYLVVAGTGPWESRYRELGKNVIVLGSMSPSELRNYYNCIDIFVNPTLRPQGLDLTLMEAMMSGKPVMATRFPSIRGTILVEDEFGFLFSPNVESLSEALVRAAEEGPERLAERGKACRRYAMSMFTARKMALAYERLFLCIKNSTFCHYGQNIK